MALDFSEGYQALQKKVIVATLQSGSMVIMFKLNEVAKNITRAYLTPASIGAWINLDVYNGMPDDIKAIFDKCGKDAQAAINADMIKLYHGNYDTDGRHRHDGLPAARCGTREMGGEAEALRRRTACGGRLRLPQTR